MDSKKYCAVGLYIVVKVIEENQDEKSGIVAVLDESDKDLSDRASRGYITSIGDGVLNEFPYQFKIGDVVIFYKESGLIIDTGVVAVEFNNIVSKIGNISEK
jgi:co-chaperonin GroES (HSP10)